MAFVYEDLPYKEAGWQILVFNIVVLFIARAANVIICSLLLNLKVRKTIISVKMQVMSFFSGLRGAMAFALAMESIEDYPRRGRIMLLITITFALFTIFGLASALRPVMEALDITDKQIGKSVASLANKVKEDGILFKCKKALSDFEKHSVRPIFSSNAKPAETELQ